MPIVCNPVTAEDILQETFIQVYRSLPRFRGGSFKHWLARIATNKAIDWKRKFRQSLETMVEYPEQVGGPGLNPGSSVEDEVIYKETIANLLSLCQELPEDYRHTFTGFYLEGKDYRALATEGGVTVKTVESRLYRARKMLREKLKEG
ncbi:ECF RNA polymerase sigma factor SigE [Moorella thermoacetica]|uniref:ECF RNA polymerase sigma factor SigE n=1 Tax=Neomoorella thermoacetica TaxID=1525 RepID=A0A1J5NJ42_NEOTH|nr:ECF RNA polymerase sigma factor SigE [Moorella thermoacetica]